MSDFRNSIRQSLKTKEQLEQERILAEQQRKSEQEKAFDSTVGLAVDRIHQSIERAASRGEYVEHAGKKIIRVQNVYINTSEFLFLVSSDNNTVKESAFFKACVNFSRYGTKQKTTFEKLPEFDRYISRIKEALKKDDISCEVKCLAIVGRRNLNERPKAYFTDRTVIKSKLNPEIFFEAFVEVYVTVNMSFE